MSLTIRSPLLYGHGRGDTVHNIIDIYDDDPMAYAAESQVIILLLHCHLASIPFGAVITPID